MMGADILQTQASGCFTEKPLLLCLSQQVPTDPLKDLGLPILSYLLTIPVSLRVSVVTFLLNGRVKILNRNKFL